MAKAETLKHKSGYSVRLGEGWVAGFVECISSDTNHRSPAIVGTIDETARWDTMEEAIQEISRSCTIGCFYVVDNKARKDVVGIKRESNGAGCTTTQTRRYL